LCTGVGSKVYSRLNILRLCDLTDLPLPIPYSTNEMSTIGAASPLRGPSL
jgi:hypothetical protein